MKEPEEENLVLYGLFKESWKEAPKVHVQLARLLFTPLPPLRPDEATWVREARRS
jgi:hypothetical protein